MITPRAWTVAYQSEWRPEVRKQTSENPHQQASAQIAASNEQQLAGTNQTAAAARQMNAAMSNLNELTNRPAEIVGRYQMWCWYR
jgi:methyl-accepting chemotaxis protein